MKRRDFLKMAGVSVGAAAVGRAFGNTGDSPPPPNGAQHPLPRRPYGKDGVQLSVIGLGGIVVMNAEQATADRVVADAIERGVTYFDVAPTYGDAELKLGPALEPYRKDVFLAGKTTQRRRPEAQAELDRTLTRLRTDHLDLYQLHGLTDMVKDVDAAFSKDGALEVLVEAKKQGRVRYLGFSAHTEEAALAAMERYDFDSVLFPVNFVCWMTSGFGPTVVETARRKDMTILALKAMAKQRWTKGDATRAQYRKCWYQPLADPAEAELGLRFTLSQPVAAALPPGEESLFRMALGVADPTKPLTAEELERLRSVADGLNPIFAS